MDGWLLQQWNLWHKHWSRKSSIVAMVSEKISWGTTSPSNHEQSTNLHTGEGEYEHNCSHSKNVFVQWISRCGRSGTWSECSKFSILLDLFYLNLASFQNDPSSGRLRGFILRSQLIVILKNSFYEETQQNWIDEVSIDDFRDEYPRYPSIDVSVTFSYYKEQVRWF